MTLILLLIAVIVYLLSVFSDGLALIEKRATIENNQIGELLKAQMGKMASFDPAIVDKSNKALKKNETDNARRIELLTPERQIIRIFGTLFFALLCLMCSFLVKNVNLELSKNWYYIGLLILSFLSFIIGLFVLKQVAWAVIETKKLVARESVEGSKLSISVEEK